MPRSHSTLSEPLLSQVPHGGAQESDRANELRNRIKMAKEWDGMDECIAGWQRELDGLISTKRASKPVHIQIKELEAQEEKKDKRKSKLETEELPALQEKLDAAKAELDSVKADLERIREQKNDLHAKQLEADTDSTASSRESMWDTCDSIAAAMAESIATAGGAAKLPDAAKQLEALRAHIATCKAKPAQAEQNTSQQSMDVEVPTDAAAPGQGSNGSPPKRDAAGAGGEQKRQKVQSPEEVNQNLANTVLQAAAGIKGSDKKTVDAIAEAIRKGK